MSSSSRRLKPPPWNRLLYDGGGGRSEPRSDADTDVRLWIRVALRLIGWQAALPAPDGCKIVEGRLSNIHVAVDWSVVSAVAEAAILFQYCETNVEVLHFSLSLYS